jgi:hypothetical protein
MNLLLDHWKEFEKNCIPADFGRDQRRTAMFGFYVSAASIADRLPEHSELTTQLKIECQAFANLLSESFPPQSS